MIETVFISDLHLHPEEPAIKERFDAFIEWAKKSVATVYILGDFFHAWIGDDGMDEWSRAIAAQIYSLKNQGIKVYYLHGNRDFLLGKEFAKLSGWELLHEPAFVTLGSESVLLMHGDSYCTKDQDHQRFRKLTRNKLFPLLFLRLPLSFRQQLVDKVRKQSMASAKSMEAMDVVQETVVQHMQQLKKTVLIHGHTHKCAIIKYQQNGQELTRYVLSDWDNTPQILCYDSTRGLFFTKLD